MEDVSISRDGHNMLLMCSEDDGMCLRVFEAGVTPPETNDDEEEVDFEQPGPESGLVPLASRLVLNVRMLLLGKLETNRGLFLFVAFITQFCTLSLLFPPFLFRLTLWRSGPWCCARRGQR